MAKAKTVEDIEAELEAAKVAVAEKERAALNADREKAEKLAEKRKPDVARQPAAKPDEEHTREMADERPKSER